MSEEKQVAHAMCMFCGRFVSKENASMRPFFLTIYVGANQTPKAMTVADAIWCGTCRPQPVPQEMPEIY